MSFGAILETNALYSSDSSTFSNTLSSTKINYDLGIGFHLSKSFIYELVYGSSSGVDKIGATSNTITITDEGIKFGLFMGRQKQWFSGLTYNFITTAILNNGTSDVQLRGTSIKFDLGYLIWINSNYSFGVKFNYYAPTFTEQIVTTTITNVSYSRTFMYPGISFIYDN